MNPVNLSCSDVTLIVFEFSGTYGKLHGIRRTMKDISCLNIGVYFYCNTQFSIPILYPKLSQGNIQFLTVLKSSSLFLLRYRKYVEDLTMLEVVRGQLYLGSVNRNQSYREM